ncbi:Ger(x)C family spore germination protein [Sporolactobacillus vineae]|uniref:Ger(x)C family spore germination protein n=1 Tax=Sporolactobacillus vineae TaxID=444463 RepID=UPI000287E3FD|nr:Ger(x)C family spore germination protein [Sporolactobacillus vineae]
MRIKILLLCLFLLLLTGCLPSNIIDDILMVEAEGYDYLGKGQIMGTATMPNYVESGNPGSQGAGLPSTAAMMRYISGVTYDGKSLVDKFQPEGQRQLKIGKIRVMLFDDKLARHGLSKQLDFRNRDPDTPRDLTLAVVEGSTREMLTAADYQTQIPVSRYIQDLIQQNSQQNYPDSDLAQILYSYYGEYMDAFMPIIQKQGDHLALVGVAAFKKDKYVMKIDGDDVFVFKMLFQPFDQGVYDYEFARGKHIALRNVHTSASFKVRNGNSSSPDIYARVKISAQVRQAFPGSISKKNADHITKLLNRHLEWEARQLVHRFQTYRVDPLGLGNTVRSFTYRFDGHSWPDRYPHARFHCRVNVNIVQTGISQ